MITHPWPRFALTLITAAALWFCAPYARAECGAQAAPCVLDQGEYFVALPDAPQGVPAVLWLHGYGRSGAMMVAKTAATAPFIARGYAVILPSGQRYFEGSDALDWGVRDGHDAPRDDIAFLRAVLSDAISRFSLDDTRIIAAGFSRGGSMVWDLACLAPDTAAAYAAVAGAFWEPMAGDCAAPVNLYHTHGFGDRLVPFEGREVTFQKIRFVQGSVMKGVNIWRRENGCMGSAKNDTADGTLRKRWTDCTAGSVTLSLVPGGHAVPKGWRDEVLDWFEGLSQTSSQ